MTIFVVLTTGKASKTRIMRPYFSLCGRFVYFLIFALFISWTECPWRSSPGCYFSLLAASKQTNKKNKKQTWHPAQKQYLDQRR